MRPRRPQGGGYSASVVNQVMSRYPRVPPRLDRIFRNNPVYFATFCTYKRRAILANGTVEGAFREFAMRAYTEHNIALGRYVIMPEHIHLFVCGPDDFSLGPWIGSLKQALAKSMGRRRAGDVIWQRASSIIFCEATKATGKNGITFARIPYALVWLRKPKIGLMRVRSLSSLGMTNTVAAPVGRATRASHSRQRRASHPPSPCATARQAAKRLQ
jgi:REP element-mobilizing transposase RayT